MTALFSGAGALSPSATALLASAMTAVSPSAIDYED